MPSYRDFFPSKYLSAAEITAPYDCTLSIVQSENVSNAEKPEPPKPVAYFEEDGCKPVVLNRTRAEAIEEIVGTDDYTRWIGKRVRISKGVTRYGNKRVPCIVIGPTSASAESDIPF